MITFLAEREMRKPDATVAVSKVLEYVSGKIGVELGSAEDLVAQPDAELIGVVTNTDESGKINGSATLLKLPKTTESQTIDFYTIGDDSVEEGATYESLLNAALDKIGLEMKPYDCLVYSGDSMEQQVAFESVATDRNDFDGGGEAMVRGSTKEILINEIPDESGVILNVQEKGPNSENVEVPSRVVTQSQFMLTTAELETFKTAHPFATNASGSEILKVTGDSVGAVADTLKNMGDILGEPQESVEYYLRKV